MDNNNSDNENGERRNSNTEYVPTKCRVTKPPPPRPATNPLQFIKVTPSALFQKAHEQIKRVEEIKKERKEVREEAEDWQQNLDNWKSSRRKRQEHIIERVVEVKKLEQDGNDRNRRKSKTFNEMMEERSKGRHKFNIPIYEDEDSNDLSGYGIVTSSSKAGSLKDTDTEDNTSILNDDECTSNWPSGIIDNENSTTSSQSQSDDKSIINKKKPIAVVSNPPFTSEQSVDVNENSEYTYEGAIEDYRSRIKSKIHMDDSALLTKTSPDYFESKELTDAQVALPKGEICKRKERFEGENPMEIHNYESIASRRLSEDFVNTQSIKQRLQSLEKCTSTDRSMRAIDKNGPSAAGGVQQRIEHNNRRNDIESSSVPKIDTYLQQEQLHLPSEKDDGSKVIDWKRKEADRSGSPETELYMDKLNTFSKDLDLMYKKNVSSDGLLDDYYPNYAPSTSSTEITDRDDSGIHTADVSRSVSQADEPIDDLSSSCVDEKMADTDAPRLVTTSMQIQICPRANRNPPAPSNVEFEDSSFELPASSSPPGRQADDVAVEFGNVPPAIYENVQFGSNDFSLDSAFPLSPPTIKEPPKVKPPPPPPPSALIDSNRDDDHHPDRIKREMHIKRSSFLGLDSECTDNQIYQNVVVDNKPPDVNSFLQRESKLERSLYKMVQEETRMGTLSKVESHDSGLDIDRGRLSSDTWCTGSIGDSTTPSPERHDSEQTNSITSEEDEITKKEREIIETIEKEEKSRDIVELPPKTKANCVPPNVGRLASEAYFPKEAIYLNHGQDSEVLKVEHELLQLEREELERQRENRQFEESRMKARLQNGRHSTENLFQDGHRYQNASFCHLRHVPPEYRKSLPDVPNAYYMNNNGNERNVYKVSDDVHDCHRKSMTDFHKFGSRSGSNVDHRKSMPDLEQLSPSKRQPILPGKPLRPPPKERERFLLGKSDVAPASSSGGGRHRHLLPSRHNSAGVSAVPSSWLQPRANPQTKSYNQHWLCQEAEFRRLSDAEARRPKQDKPIPDAVIQNIQERMQSRELPVKRPEAGPGKQVVPPPHSHSYLRVGVGGHALPLPYASQMVPEESQDHRMLSVSGKKKCSFCSNELGRGAAMIIESLCLFYHMKCFKCCVCHTQLGDGLNGTDVRVRNQKLHCQNCYSSDDGIKFSCV